MVTQVTIKVVITTIPSKEPASRRQLHRKTPKALQINRESRIKIATALYIKTPKALLCAVSPAKTNGKPTATHRQSTQNRQQPAKFRPQALFEPLLTLTHAKAAKRQHTRKLTNYRKGLKMKLKTTKYIIEFPENNMPSAIHDNYYTVKSCSAVPTSRRIPIPSYYIRDCCIFTDIKRREAKRILDRFLDQFF